MCGRLSLSAFVATLLLLATSAAGAAHNDRESAATAFSDMQQRFARADGLYRETDGGGYATVWPVSQAIAATLTLARIGERTPDDLRNALLELEPYRNGTAYDSAVRPPYGGGGAQYYDDNEWIALDLLEAHALLGDPVLLRRAQAVFGFVVSGWDGDGAHACPGGVFWTRDAGNHDRNTVSTANAAVLALELYAATRDPGYLRWGRLLYAWVVRCLRAPDGLYWDHLTLDGTIERHEWTYNQGAMVAAGVLLARATGKRRYLDAAGALAATALRRFGATRYSGEPVEFVAIFFRYLRLLDDVQPTPAYRAALRTYADSAVRRPARTLLEQAGLVQIYAQLALPRKTRFPAPRSGKRGMFVKG